MTSKRNTGDDMDLYYEPIPGIGSASTYTPRCPDDKPLPREFWIGFHCSAPGPSDAPDGPPVKPRRRKQ